ncbi:MAG: hypothetical protein ACJ77K_19335 [Bacteroidia bacterium]
MAVHIGKIIYGVYKQTKMPMKEFCGKLGRDRDICYKMFKRETIDTGVLLEVSKVLNHDFFQYYAKGVATIDKSKPATKKDIQEVLDAISKLSKKK